MSGAKIVEKGPAEGLECALFAYQKKNREKGCVIYGGGESTVLFMRVHMESNKKERNISNIPQPFSRRLQGLEDQGQVCIDAYYRKLGLLQHLP